MNITDFRLLLLTVVYALVGFGLLYIGYRIFDQLTPGDAQDKIFKENNTAVAILVGAFIIGLALIIAAAISG
jgi:uncharacterized membrane protein YjfL (UPF0719 family)